MESLGFPLPSIYLEVMAAHTVSALDTALSLAALRDGVAQDPLTGQGHGAIFHEDLARALEGPVTTAVLLIDLDNSSRSTTRSATWWVTVCCWSVRASPRGELRGSDRLYRVVGDEFAAILSVWDDLRFVVNVAIDDCRGAR